VTIIVCDKAGQEIPGELRGAWLRRIHPKAEVLVIEDTLPDDDSRAWAENTLRILGRAPDAVFTSEDYGPHYAGFLGSEHVMVDRERAHVPISATRIRASPLDHLEYLEPCVRAHYVRRVCVIGAESTGSTTLARALADELRTAWVPEYGRTYSEGRWPSGNPPWRSEEFVHIARVQQSMEDELAGIANRILICDTNAFATCFWHERYMGFWSDEVEEISRGCRYDLYLLTGDEIAFVQDGVRDGESIRHAMQQRFAEELVRRNLPHVVLTGSHEERLKAARDAIARML
jgi:NadR type nicotinamide-nucleotide adenylyltransferase